MNMMNDLASALTAGGFTVKQTGQTLFVGQWGIHCTLTGNVQARNVFDPSERFGLGTVQTPADAMAAAFAAGM